MVVLGILAWNGACGKDRVEAAARKAQPVVKDVSASVTGRVVLASGARLPRYAAASLQRRVLRVGIKGPQPACAAQAEAASLAVNVTGDGALVGVAVVASGFTKPAIRPPQVHEVVIDECRLQPSMLVAMKGDEIVIRNNVDFPFMPMYGTTSMARSLLPGQQFDFKLDQGGHRDAIVCAVTAMCGRTDVLTLHHRLYAVTDERGRFRIEDFPADEPVRLSVWHPLFASVTQEVQVAIGEDKEIEFVVTPHTLEDVAAAAESAATVEGHQGGQR